MAMGVIKPLEVIDIDHEDGEGALVSLRPRQLLGQDLWQISPIVQAGESIDDGQLMKIGVPFAERLIGRYVLVAKLPQASHHIVENLRHVAHFTAAVDRKIHIQVPDGDLARAPHETTEWAYDCQAEHVGSQTDGRQDGGDQGQSDIAQSHDCRIGLDLIFLGHDAPVQLGDAGPERVNAPDRHRN